MDSKQAQLVHLREAGKKAFKNKSYVKAIKIYSEALKLDNESPVWYSNRAMVYTRLEKWDKSLTDCRKGLLLHPEGKIMVKLLWRKGVSLINLSQFEEAEQCLLQAKAIDPKNSAVAKSLEDLEVSKNDVISIPIQEVDHLPADLLKFEKISTVPSQKNVPENSYEQELDKIEGVTVPSIKKATTIGIKPTEPQHANESDLFTDTTKFPLHPSVYFLSTLKARLTSENEHTYYLYILHLEPEIYRTLYKNAGVDSNFLQLYVDAAIWYFESSNDGSYSKRIADTVKIFTGLPRFMLTSMYIPSGKSKKLLDDIQSKTGLDLHSSW